MSQAIITALKALKLHGMAANYPEVAAQARHTEFSPEAFLGQLLRAEQAAEQAWVRGAAGYFEWTQLQSQRMATQLELLGLRSDAHRALIELQRLTGESFLPNDAATTESQP